MRVVSPSSSSIPTSWCGSLHTRHGHHTLSMKQQKSLKQNLNPESSFQHMLASTEEKHCHHIQGFCSPCGPTSDVSQLNLKRFRITRIFTPKTAGRYHKRVLQDDQHSQTRFFLLKTAWVPYACKLAEFSLYLLFFFYKGTANSAPEIKIRLYNPNTQNH